MLDTRLDPFLPRNAVYARAAWDRFNLEGGAVARSELDGRGYIGLWRQNVLALRAQRTDSSGVLPPYLQPLLGGMANLRGFEAGYAAGDTLVAGSLELILPLTSPLSVGRLGVSAFVDTGTVYGVGERLADQDFRRGVGGTLWFSAAMVRVGLAVAHGIGGKTHVHVGGSVLF